MKCGECNGEYVEITGDIELYSHIIGKYFVPKAHHYLCENCGNLLLPGETWKTADRFLKSAIKSTLEGFPIKEFMSAADTAEYLGITKQALHKHRKIKNGFIFSLTHGGRTEYLRKSVELFKDLGDGRFPLHEGIWKINTANWVQVREGGNKSRTSHESAHVAKFGKMKSDLVDPLSSEADTYRLQGIG